LKRGRLVGFSIELDQHLFDLINRFCVISEERIGSAFFQESVDIGVLGCFAISLNRA
jgi:hypothetical protein